MSGFELVFSHELIASEIPNDESIEVLSFESVVAIPSTIAFSVGTAESDSSEKELSVENSVIGLMSSIPPAYIQPVALIPPYIIIEKTNNAIIPKDILFLVFLDTILITIYYFIKFRL